MNPRVTKVRILSEYRLFLTFSNGEHKLFSVEPYLEKGVFKDLKRDEIFRTAQVIDGTVQWINEADFCPDTLYLESQTIADDFFIC